MVCHNTVTKLSKLITVVHSGKQTHHPKYFMTYIRLTNGNSITKIRTKSFLTLKKAPLARESLISHLLDMISRLTLIKPNKKLPKMMKT